MKLTSKVYQAKSLIALAPPDYQEWEGVLVPLCAGAPGGTVVKSLTLFSVGANPLEVEIIRKDGQGVAYQTLRILMPGGGHRIVWDDFHVLEEGHSLSFKADSTLCAAVAVCHEGFNNEQSGS